MSEQRDPKTDQQLPKDGQVNVFPALGFSFEDVYRKQYDKGIEKYGKTLQTFNGRDAGQDALEEWFDLGVYMKQLHMEHTVMKQLLTEARARLEDYAEILEAPVDLPNLIYRIGKVL